ncbi:YdiU family protein [Parasphingopyxis algicola]|uniref:protein adenylyltransferase SelO family protein n=1 Tax=Parasphingopyxis algicola TaxID=2026624 RepID=UPI00159F83F8|nr:YdiU family protein [Parasphingopyxis algicola]QLC23872.1 YdiU family protein [Parasphingopyxis algicola]
MSILPQASTYRPETAIHELGADFYDPVEAAQFPQHVLRFRNDRWAETVGLAGLSDEQWIAHFGRFEPLDGSLQQPLALRYHGHQFRSYNPEIGDGRGFLFAQMRDGADRLMDLGTKGSGQTPYSRFGDGRLTLKGGVREILATEMLEALGVETSKTFSLIETGEALERNDEPSPTRSSVMVRLSHGHIRIGTFQRLATLREPENMKTLIAYCLKHYFGEEAAEDGPEKLLAHVVAGGARLAASYMAAGFVHGVLNSDNIAITTESFDYGPWRFTPNWEPGFTAAYFDQTGLYAFARQAEAIHWDIAQLAVSLRLIEEAEPLIKLIEGFGPLYQDAYRESMLGRLGVESRSRKEDVALLTAIEKALRESDVTIDRFFFDWRGGQRRGGSPADPAYDDDAFAAVAEAMPAYRAASPRHAYWSDPDPCSMLIEEVEAIWSRIDEADDWQPLTAKVEGIRRMGEAMQGH